MNLWHDVPLGEKAPEEFNVIIEIPKGSNNKYEIDKETGLIALDRANYSAAAYPFDYGFAPQTYWDDEDALDVIVLTTYPLFSGVLVRVRPVALLEMTDGGDADDKVVAVPVEDKRWDDVRTLSDLNRHSLKEYRHFVETYKVLKGEDNPIVFKGYKDRDAAQKAVTRATELYQKEFGK